MENMERKAIAGLILLLTGMLSMALAMPAKAQYAVDSNTVALWHFDDVNTNNVTLDATGKNPAILGGTPPPMFVEGKFGKTLSFNGNNSAFLLVSPLLALPSPYPDIYVPIHPSLNIPAEITIEAWINFKAFKNTTYNNVVVECTRTGVQIQNVSRIWGLAVWGGSEAWSEVKNPPSVPKGALVGYVFTDTGGFNEIATTKPVISLNQWTNVTFTRSLTRGMQIHVNGEEMLVETTYGVQNPTGSMKDGTELYIGEDYNGLIDEVRISNPLFEQQISLLEIDIGPNLLVALVIVAVVLAIAWLLRRAIQTWGVRSRSKS
jgi:hypothetical protein